MVTRQNSRTRRAAPAMNFKKPELDGRKRRSTRAHDLRLARYCEAPHAQGGLRLHRRRSGGRLPLSRARQAFEDIEFHPGILRPAPEVDTSVEILGGRSALPFGSPPGSRDSCRPRARPAGASAAGAAGIPFTLSTLGTTSVEEVGKANPDGRNWFQLYVMRDRDISYGLARRAAAAGFDTLHVHGRHADRGRPPARQAQRLLDPAAAHRRHDRQRDPAPLVVVRLPDHAQARVRVAVVDRRHRRRAARTRRWTRPSATTTSRSSARCGPARSSSRGCRTSRTRCD